MTCIHQLLHIQLRQELIFDCTLLAVALLRGFWNFLRYFNEMKYLRFSYLLVLICKFLSNKWILQSKFSTPISLLFLFCWKYLLCNWILLWLWTMAETLSPWLFVLWSLGTVWNKKSCGVCSFLTRWTVSCVLLCWWIYRGIMVYICGFLFVRTTWWCLKYCSFFLDNY